MTRDMLLVWGVGSLLGLVLHHLVLTRGEWHKQAPEFLLSHVWILASLSILKYYFRDSDVEHMLAISRSIFIVYLLSLFISITLYRTTFHRLTRAGFPGPWRLRVSKIFHVWICRNNQNHLWVHGLRERYGDFVRTGEYIVYIADS